MEVPRARRNSAGRAQNTRPKRTRKQALSSGAQLALKHIESAEQAFDDIYDETWGKKAGKHVYNKADRSMFVRDAHETLYNDVAHGPEFLCNQDLAERTLQILVEDASQETRGSDALTAPQKEKLARLAHTALQQFVEAGCLFYCGLAVVAEMCETYFSVFHGELLRLSVGLPFDGSKPRKKLTAAQVREQIERVATNFQNACAHRSAYDLVHNDLGVEILETLATLPGDVAVVKHLIENQLRVDIAAEADEEEDEEQQQQGDEEEEDYDEEEEDEEEDDDDFESLVDEEDDEEDRRIAAEAREQDRELEAELAQDDGEDVEFPSDDDEDSVDSD